MNEENVQAVESVPSERTYAHVKVYPSDVRMTRKVFENENGTKRTSAFVHCPKGMKINGVDLSGYEIRTTLAEFQVDSIKSGKPISLGLDAERDVTVFKGFDKQFEMVDPMNFNAWDFCKAMKQAVTAREAAKEGYVRINIPARDVHVFEQTSRAGNTYQKAAATLPEGTVIEGVDVSGRTAFFFMSRFNIADLEAGRATIGFSVKRDEAFDILAEGNSGLPAVKASGEDLAAAVRAAIEKDGAAIAGEHGMVRGASLADLEASARTATEAMGPAPLEEDPAR